MLFRLRTAAALCELSLKIILPHCTAGICHFPSSQLGQSKSKLQFESHRGNSVILLTRIILNLVRQVRWPDTDGLAASSDVSAEPRLLTGRMAWTWRTSAEIIKEHYKVF